MHQLKPDFRNAFDILKRYQQLTTLVALYCPQIVKRDNFEVKKIVHANSNVISRNNELSSQYIFIRPPSYWLR